MMHSFEEYLQQQNLEALSVSIKAGVRYLTVYNALKGIPITPAHAQRLRQAVLQMSGIPFRGSFVLTQPEVVDELPTLPITSIPKSHFIK